MPSSAGGGGAGGWSRAGHPGHRRIHQRSVCREMLASAVPEVMSMGFSRQYYWSGLPFPSPVDLPHPGMEPRSPAL